MKYEIVIIGAGISGITAAIELEKRSIKDVLIIEHQPSVGGFTKPFHQHAEFKKEKEIVEKAEALPYKILLKTTVLGLYPAASEQDYHQLFVQGPKTSDTIEAKKVLIATGSLEKPREGNVIPGSRPSGVMTPYMAMNLLDKGINLGEHVVVFGDGRIAKSTADKLKPSKNCTVFDHTYSLERIEGVSHISSIHVKNNETNRVENVTCDTLIYSYGRIASGFFLKGSEIEMVEDYKIVVDEEGRTQVPGVYAVGSCTTLGEDNHENSIELTKRIVKKLWV